MHEAFGENVPVSNPIREALLRAPALKASDVMLMLRERYETTYGIYNHDAPSESRPLAVVALHPKEDVFLGSLLYERLDQFVDYDVFKYTGLAWDQFMDLPRHLCERILEVCYIRKQRRDKALDGVAQELQEKLDDNR